jgi:hypothetical protein
MQRKALLFICPCFFILALSCSKDKTDDMLLGEWRFRSQSDVVGGARGYFLFNITPPKKINFSLDGKAYSEGIVTPTWLFLPAMGHASYHVKNNIITIGDSVFHNGGFVYTNLRIQFKIVSISQNLLVLQHLYRYNDPVPPVTIDTLIR